MTQASSNLTGERRWRARRQWSMVRLSLPPERPSITLSPSLIMPYCPMASPGRGECGVGVMSEWSVVTVSE